METKALKVGMVVQLRQCILADKRGHWIPCGTALEIVKVVGPQHVHLNYPHNDRRAATQVHHSNFKVIGYIDEN